MSAKVGTLLVEARTEELPPQLLRDLADQFPDGLLANLRKAGFADDDSRRATASSPKGGNDPGRPKLLATPRRIAAQLTNIRRKADDRTTTRRGPQVAAGLDSGGAPTKALAGFMRATGTQLSDLRKVTERGKEYFAADIRDPGGDLDGKLAAITESTLLSLNAPRLMRWGANDWRFIRPLRGLVMLWESEVIPGEVMGIKSARKTLGHRFLSAGPVTIPSAEEYESVLEKANVIVDLRARADVIGDGLTSEAGKLGVMIFPDDEVGPVSMLRDDSGFYPDDSGYFLGTNFSLRDEVAEICEHPSVARGTVDRRFLELPAKCVAMCMQKHQRFFPLAEKGAEQLKLSPHYLAVADNAPEDSSRIVDGYNRVLSARLADLAFYLSEDRKAAPEDNREKLKRIAYHENLGSQFDRAERIRVVARAFAKLANVPENEIERAAFICKAGMPTLTVGEYPELAGYIAALLFADDDQTRRAVEAHEETGAGHGVGMVLALANHMEKLVGFFGVGEKPTGSKDPFGLRRAAADVASILMTSPLECPVLIDAARESFDDLPHFNPGEIYDYIADRLRQHDSILATGAGTAELNAILSPRPARFLHVRKTAEALVAFGKAPEAKALIEANKRINNIFRKSDLSSLPGADGELRADGELFECDEERRLFAACGELQAKKPRAMIAAGNFDRALRELHSLAAPLDDFFEKVMVNADDKKIRANRFALLSELRALLNQVADISKLAG